MDQDKMSNLYRESSIDASYQVSVHLDEGFRRRRLKCEKKPLSQMNRNLVGSNYGRSSINFAHFVPIHLQIWPPQAILVSDRQIKKNLLL
jgi:hypothetical protein